MNGKVVFVVVIGLLFICVGVNYETITSWFNKDPKKEEVIEPLEITPISQENYVTDVGRYFNEKEERQSKAYLVMNVDIDSLTITDKPRNMNEISNIKESKYKKYKFAPDVEIYYYNVIIKKDANTVIDKLEEVKTLNISEVSSIVKLKEECAYIEFDNNKIRQLLIFNKKEEQIQGTK